jgi:hypothetical protein
MTNNTVNLDVGDKRAGRVSILYLLLSLGFMGWLLFDIWIDSHFLARVLRYNTAELKTPIYHLVAYTVLGGAIGGIVNGLRSAITYYKGFDPDYFWKYIAAPWMGAALALIGFALLKSTVAIFGGTAASATADTPQFLANFAIGALAGYGSKDVFVWLDSQVHNLFASKKETPDTTGKPVDLAVNQVQEANLSVGKVVATRVDNSQEAGRVLEQVPAPGTMIDSGDAVSMVVGTHSNGKRSTKNKKPRKPSDS